MVPLRPPLPMPFSKNGGRSACFDAIDRLIKSGDIKTPEINQALKGDRLRGGIAGVVFKQHQEFDKPQLGGGGNEGMAL